MTTAVSRVGKQKCIAITRDPAKLGWKHERRSLVSRDQTRRKFISHPSCSIDAQPSGRRYQGGFITTGKRAHGRRRPNEMNHSCI